MARSIICSRCGADDTLAFIPRHETTALCRKCAAETLQVPDVEAGIMPPDPNAPDAEPPAPPSERRTTGKGVIRVRRREPDDPPHG